MAVTEVKASASDVLVLGHHRGRHASAKRRRRLFPDAGSLVLAAVVAVQITAVMVFGVLTIQRDPLWSPVDEGAHYDNVIYVAAHGSYPILGKTLVAEQVLAIGQGVYPRHTTINPRTFGLGGLAYEAFQPPLYYYVAAPVSLLSGNYHTKAVLLRYFGLLLLVVSIALMARLSYHVLGRRWLLGLAGGLLVFLMPGFIVRMTTISNMNLAVPLAILTVTELWIAWQRQSPLRLVLCGFLVGCGVLTDLYMAAMLPLYLVVAVTMVWGKRNAATLIPAVLGAVLAGVVVLPWVVFNELKYHALTATAIAKREQIAIINPHHLRNTVGQVPNLTASQLFQPLMPQEWGDRLVGHDFYSYGITLIQILLVPGGIVLTVALGRRLLSSGLWMLVLPWACNVLLCWYVFIGAQWGPGTMLPRYTYPTLPLLALFGVAAVVVLFSTIRPLLVTLIVSTGFMVALWVFLVPSIPSS